MATKRRTPQNDILHRLSGNKKSAVQTPLIARRYTPYTKSNQRSKVVSRTPLPLRQQKQRTQDGGRPLRTKNGRKESSEGLSSIVVGKTWRVHRASPFYRLKFDRKSLQNYERRLNDWLLSCESDSTRQTKRIKTSFRKVDGDSVDEYGIEIKVYCGKEKVDTQKDSPDLIAVLYCGIIDEETTREDEKEQGNASSVVYGSSEFISFPVVLIKGPVLLKESFLQWLEGQFGCKVCPLLLSPMELAWLVSLCSGIGEPLHSTELTYHVPPVVPGLDTICFTIAAKDAKLIWDAVHDSTVDYFTNEEALKFLKSLESHFYCHFKIHLDQMQLTTIATSVAFVGKEGRVKILQKNYVCYILRQFVQVSKKMQMPIY